jgi:hypothetical protein
MKNIKKTALIFVIFLSVFFVTPSCFLLQVPQNTTDDSGNTTGSSTSKGKTQGTEDQIDKGTSTTVSDSTRTATDKKKEKQTKKED